MADRSLRIKLLADTSSYRSEMERASRLGGNYAKAAQSSSQRLTAYLNQNTTAFAGLNKNIQVATNTMKGFVGVFAGGFALNGIVDLADNWGQTSARIKMALQSVEGSANSYNQVQDRLLEISNRNAKAIEDSQNLYVATASSMRDLGYSTSRTIDFIESLSNSYTINATSSEKVKSSIDAITKSLITGKVGTEQWKTIMASTPNVVAELANSTGKSEQAIKQLGISGKISTTQLINALIQAKDRTSEMADGMGNTVRDGFTQISNSFKHLIGELNNSSGVTQAVAGGLRTVADNIGLITGAGATLIALSLARYFGNLSTSIRVSIAETIKNTAETMNLAAAQKQALTTTIANIQAEKQSLAISLKFAEANWAVAKSVEARTVQTVKIRAIQSQIIALDKAEATSKLSLATATRQASVASVALNKAQGLLKGGLALIGGPVGAAMIAGGALYYFMQQAKQARDEAVGLADKVKYLNEELGNFSDEKLVVIKQDAINDIKNAEEQLKGLRQEMDSTLELINGDGFLGFFVTDERRNKAIEKRNEQLLKQKEISDGIVAANNLISKSDGFLQSRVGPPAPVINNLPNGKLLPTDTTLFDEQKKRLDGLILNTKLLTEYDKIHYELTSGSLTDLLPEQRTELENLAKKLDLIKKQTELEQERKNLAKTGLTFANQEIFNNASQLEQIDLTEQEKLKKLAEWRETGLADEQTYQDALTAITDEAVKQRKKIDDNAMAAKQDNMSAILSSTSDLFGGMSGLIGNFSNNQGAAYKSMFAISKGFAIANAALNLQTAISEAMKLPWPANVPAISQAISMGAQVASNIASINYGGGREHGGTVGANSMYRVGESNKPEILMAGGRQYMIPGENGRVISNKDIQGSSSIQANIEWTFIVENNASNTQIQQPDIDRDKRIVKWAVNEVSSSIQNHTGEVWSAMKNSTNIKAKL